MYEPNMKTCVTFCPGVLKMLYASLMHNHSNTAILFTVIYCIFLAVKPMTASC